MRNWYYYTQPGEKIGPISVEELKNLASQGVITIKTVIENYQGHKFVAGTLNGLVFPKESLLDTALTLTTCPATPPPFTVPKSTDDNIFMAPICHTCQQAELSGEEVLVLEAATTATDSILPQQAWMKACVAIGLIYVLVGLFVVLT